MTHSHESDDVTGSGNTPNPTEESVSYRQGKSTKKSTNGGGVSRRRNAGNAITTTLEDETAGREPVRRERDVIANQRAFLAAYRLSGVVTEAAGAAGIDPGTAWRWQQKDEAFASAMNLAYREAADRLETEARRRAEKGVRRPVLHHGKLVKLRNPKTKRLEPLYEHTFSDALMAKLLNGFKPDKYQPAGSSITTTTNNLQVNVATGVLPGWFARTSDAAPTPQPATIEEPAPRRRIPAAVVSGDNDAMATLLEQTMDAITGE